MARKHISVLVLILSLSAQTVFAARSAPAATITVTSKLDTSDLGKCRLRDAIIAANTNAATGDCPAGAAGLDIIDFNLGLQCSITPCTITLTGPLPTVTEALTINGSNTIVSGAHSFRVFDLGGVTVSISNLSIIDGNMPGTAVTAVGGAINMSNTTLILDHVFFSNNHADYGGAIYEPSGDLIVSHSRFSGNGAEHSGGAIDEEDSGTSGFTDTIFSGNTAQTGGALRLVSGAVIQRSTFSSNSAAAFGGAIVKIGLGTLNISDSTLDHNASTSVATGGGAIYSHGTTVMRNVTISSNSAKTSGGGIYFGSATLNLNNVTITDNTADSDADGNGDGGGIYQESDTTLVQNSIIAGNFDTPGNTGGGTINPDCSGTYSSQGFNLIGIFTGCSGFVNGVSGDKVGTAASPLDPQLGPLTNNGGSTQTHALLPGSPAIDVGNPLPPGRGGFACAASDQRGVVRPQGGTCDLGAFEFEYQSLFLPLIRR